MNKKLIGRMGLAMIAGIAALSLSACDLGTVRPGDGVGRNDPWPNDPWPRDPFPIPRVPDHHRPDHRWPGDHGPDHRGPGRRGPDHRGPERGPDHRGPGDRGGDRGRRMEITGLSKQAQKLKQIARLNESASGRLFDGSR